MNVKWKLAWNNRVLIWTGPGEKWTPQCLNPVLGAHTMYEFDDFGLYYNEGMGT